MGGIQRHHMFLIDLEAVLGRTWLMSSIGVPDHRFQIEVDDFEWFVHPIEPKIVRNPP